jgi:hypothetical protein
MSFFLNCGWYPAAGAEIQARIGQIARLLEREETVALVGSNWYRLGRSKKEAQSKPLSLAKLGDVRSWRREKFVFEETGREEWDYWLGVWNGRDPPDGASLLVHLHEPTTEVDMLVLDGPDLESLEDRWRHVLVLGEAVAHHLGGRSLVSSSTLIEWARAEGLERADMAGYAAFHPDGRSIVSAATWPEVITPDKQRAQEFIRRFRAMVGI